MTTPASKLSLINARAREIRASEPSLTWAEARKQAFAESRGGNQSSEPVPKPTRQKRTRKPKKLSRNTLKQISDLVLSDPSIINILK